MTVGPRTQRVVGARFPVLLALLGVLAAPWRGVAQDRVPDLAQRSAMAIGTDLDAAHAEFGGVDPVRLATQVPRSASLRLRWTSR